MHLVLWGHEHECRIEPEDSLDEFRITQPGSSVATSLSPGEAVPKHVGMLKVHKKDFCIEKLRLKTTRPFVFDTLSLDEFCDIGYQFANDEVVEKIRSKINDMLDFAKTLLSGKTKCYSSFVKIYPMASLCYRTSEPAYSSTSATKN